MSGQSIWFTLHFVIMYLTAGPRLLACFLRTESMQQRIVMKAASLLVIATVYIGVASCPLVAQDADSSVGRVDEIGGKKESKAAIAASSEKQKRPTRWGEPTFVGVRLYVIDVDEVNSANQNFSASVYYEARWNNPLLRHDGPGPIIRRTSEVWTPRLVFVNQQQAWSAFPSFVEILPNGDNVLRQKTWGWFSQPLDLQDFPLDQQTLTIQLVAAGLLERDVKLTELKGTGERHSGIHKGFSLPDFEVTNWAAEPRPYFPFEGEVGVPGYVVDIQIKRKPTYYVWKVIFPHCLIVIMSWVPRWLDPKESGTSIGISTTAFLTLVAYLFAITVLLPKVSYLTRLDDFIMLSTLLVFAGLMQTVMATYQLNRGFASQVETVNKVSRVIYPLLLLIVLAVSFVL